MANMNLSSTKKEKLIASGSFADLKIDWGGVIIYRIKQNDIGRRPR